MNQLLRSRLKVAASAFASNAVNDNLRRAQLSYFAAWTAEWAFTVALGIVAYRDGGATAVGLVGLLRMVPSAVVAPLAAPLADRGRRERVLVLVSSIRGVATGAAGIVVALDEPVLIVYVLAALATVAGTLYRPAHSALLPSLCRTGQELTSANAVRGMLDSVATLAGPLLAAVLVEFTGVAVVFAVAAAASLAAAALLLRLRYDAPPRPDAPRGTIIDSGLGAAKGPACDCCSICCLLLRSPEARRSHDAAAVTIPPLTFNVRQSCTPRVGPCAVDVTQTAAAAMALTAEATPMTPVIAVQLSSSRNRAA
jgi:MFS family permease